MAGVGEVFAFACFELEGDDDLCFLLLFGAFVLDYLAGEGEIDFAFHAEELAFEHDFWADDLGYSEISFIF